MKFTIELTAAQYSRLTKRARRSGLTPEILTVLGIERLLDGLDDASLWGEHRAYMCKYGHPAGSSTGNKPADEFTCLAGKLEAVCVVPAKNKTTDRIKILRDLEGEYWAATTTFQLRCVGQKLQEFAWDLLQAG